MLEIKARRLDNIIILDLNGRLDVDAAHFVEIVGQCIRDGYTDILCNFEDIEFVDYMGISVIVIAYKELTNNNGRMKLISIPAHLQKIFSITGIDKVIEIFATEELAINSFKEDKIIEKIQKLHLRRRFKRLPLDLKIELKNKFVKTPVPLEVDILDLSAVGAYIYGCGKFRLGDEVILRFKIPPKDEEMELEAKVVWLSDKEIQPHLYPGMGVEFYNISSAIQKKLLEFIEKNLPLMPTENA